MSRVEHPAALGLAGLGLAGLGLLVAPAAGLPIAWSAVVVVAGLAARACLTHPRSSPFSALGLAALTFAAGRTVQVWAAPATVVRVALDLATIGLIAVGVLRLHRGRRRPVEPETMAEVVGLVGIAVLALSITGATWPGDEHRLPWLAVAVAFGGLVVLSSLAGHGSSAPVRHLAIAATATGAAVAATVVVPEASVNLTLGAAPLVPLALAARSDRHGAEAGPEQRTVHSGPGRPAALATLGGLSATPTLLVVIGWWSAAADDRPIDPRVIGAAGLVASIALGARLVLLIRWREWSIEREREVGALAEELVVADDRQSAVAATVTTLDRLIEGRGQVAVVEVGPDGQHRIVARTGPAPRVRRPDPGAELRRRLQLPACLDHLADAPGLATAVVPGPGDGLLVVASDRRLRAELDEMIRIVANQLAVTLEVIELREAVLRDRADRQFRALARDSSDLVLVVDPDTLEICFVGPTVERLLGHREAEVLGTGILDHLDPADRDAARDLLDGAPQGAGPIDVRAIHRDRTTSWFELSARRLDDAAELHGLLVNLVDIDDRKTAESLQMRLRDGTARDPLTGLLTRSSFESELTAQLERLDPDQYLGVVDLKLLDLDDINDAVGFDLGNRLLLEVAHRLRPSVRGVDIVGRVAGDEFGVAVIGSSHRSVQRLADRVVWLFETPFELDGRSHQLKVAAGMAVSEPGQRNGPQLLRWASVALHHARHRAEDRTNEEVVVYDQQLQDEVESRFEVTAALRPALDDGQFHLVYQPLISLATDEVESFEALLRWEHPEMGSIPPATFISLAERSGVIVELGRWVVKEACRQLMEWRARLDGFQRVSMGVNLSARQLERHGELDALLYLVDGTGLDYRSLTVELTESIMVDDTGWIGSQLHHLRELGARIAIDDFGTGVAGLSHLRRLPYDLVKIDKSYIDQVGSDPLGEKLVVQIIELARGMGAASVAEGIETGRQLELLRTMGCDIGQGFHLARPMAPADLERWMTGRRTGSGFATGGAAAGA